MEPWKKVAAHRFCIHGSIALSIQEFPILNARERRLCVGWLEDRVDSRFFASELREDFDVRHDKQAIKVSQEEPSLGDYAYSTMCVS